MIASTVLSALTAALALAPSSAWAAVSPTSPSGETVVQVGQPLNALWTADGTGQWTDVVVQLMTGDNFQMIPLQTLSTNIDGTKDTQATWTTPNVTPNSKIYFLQFTKGGDVSTATWTTRFTIAGADGSTTPPTNTTSGVQWGIGQLIGADGQPIPNPTTGNINVVAGGAEGSGNGTATGGSAGAVSGASGAATGSGPATISIASASASPMASSPSTPASASGSASPMSVSSASAASASSASSSGSASATRQAASATSSGAAGQLEVAKVGGLVAGIAGLVAAALL